MPCEAALGSGVTVCCWRDTTGFSRVVFQRQPTRAAAEARHHRLQPRGASVSTYGCTPYPLNRETPSGGWLKLKHNATGDMYGTACGLKLKHHAAEAGGISCTSMWSWFEVEAPRG